MNDAITLALNCLDLTLLDETTTKADVKTLASQAISPHGKVAGLCVDQPFVATAKDFLFYAGVNITTIIECSADVIFIDDILQQAERVMSCAIDEIDITLDHQNLNLNNETKVREMLLALRAFMPDPLRLKVMIEASTLNNTSSIMRASELALDCGADFIGLSTKVPHSAFGISELMLKLLKSHGQGKGLKLSNGIASVTDALAYIEQAETIMGKGWAIEQAETIMGKGWAHADHLRFGALELYDAIITSLDADNNHQDP